MAVKKQFKGIERWEELDTRSRRDDTRSLLRKISDGLETPKGTLAFFGALAGAVATAGLYVPFAGEAVFMAALGTYGIKYASYRNRLWDAPFRVPAYLKAMGYKFRDGSTGKQGEGEIYLGWEISTGQEIWADPNDLKTHKLVLGTTGSGKTEEMMGQLFNSLMLGSGTMLLDGKSDPKTFDSIRNLCRLLGRDEDLLVINYIMGGRDFGSSGLDSKRSNTYNPLSSGSSAMKSELMVSLLDSGGGSGSDMWQGRAISFLEAITPPLSLLADKGFVLFNPRLLCDFYLLENIENLVWFGIFIDQNGKLVNLKQGSDEYKRIFAAVEISCANLKLYLDNLPGYANAKPKKPNRPASMSESEFENIAAMAAEVEAKGGIDNFRGTGKGGPAAKQQGGPPNNSRDKVLEQHGYITMQLVRATGNLTFNYGHIYNDEIGEIDYRDILLNRRVLYVMLPALERSKQSMEQLGKMALASIKGVLASLLDTPLEGGRREIIEGRPSNALIPYFIIADEYGYYVQVGFAVAPAQARSYGVSITFGAQDFPSLTRADKNEGEATWENTNLRLLGRTTGGEESETFKKISGAAGKAQISAAKEVTYRRDGLDKFQLQNSSVMTEMSRIDVDDLAQQGDGEFHFLVGMKTEKDGMFSRKGAARLVRELAFYTGDIPKGQDLRLTHYVQVKRFSDTERESIIRNEAVADLLSRVTPDDIADAIMESAFYQAEIHEDIIGRYLSHLDTAKKDAAPSIADIEAWLDDNFDKVESREDEASEAAGCDAPAILSVIEEVAGIGMETNDQRQLHVNAADWVIALWNDAQKESIGPAEREENSDQEDEFEIRISGIASRKAGQARSVLVTNA